MKKIMVVLLLVAFSLNVKPVDFSDQLIEYERIIKENYNKDSIRVSIACTDIANLLVRVINDKDIPLQLETKEIYKRLIKPYQNLAILALDLHRPKTLEDFLAKLKEEPQKVEQRSWIRRISFSKK